MILWSPKLFWPLGRILDLYYVFNTGLVGFTAADAMWTKAQYLKWARERLFPKLPKVSHKVDLDTLVDELSNPFGKGCGSDYADHEVTNLS